MVIRYARNRRVFRNLSNIDDKAFFQKYPTALNFNYILKKPPS